MLGRGEREVGVTSADGWEREGSTTIATATAVSRATREMNKARRDRGRGCTGRRGYPVSVRFWGTPLSHGLRILGSAVLGGEPAVPCNPRSASAGLNPRRRPARSEAALGAGH